MNAYGFTTFRESAPLATGWYDVIWEPGTGPKRVYLHDGRGIQPGEADKPPEGPKDPGEWCWGKDEHDDPESICLDIADPWAIAWKPAAKPRERPILFSSPMVRAVLDGRKTQTRRVVKIRGPGQGVLESIRRGHEVRGGQTCPNDWVATFRGGGTLPGGRYQQHAIACPYGAPGDRLWVRETWRVAAWRDDGRMAIDYAASPEIIRTPWVVPPGDHSLERILEQSMFDCERSNAAREADGRYVWPHGGSPCRWRPSIHIPRWACRLVLEVTGVRVERLHDISEEDAQAEGVEPWPPSGFGQMWRDYSRGGAGVASARGSFQTLWRSINGPDSWETNPWVWCIEFRRAQ